MKKILWLCNTAFTNKKISTNGSWLQPLAELLQKKDDIQLFNITLGRVDIVTKADHGSIRQWFIPIRKGKSSGQVASIISCKEVSALINEIQPDLVHIWGTESIWASIYEQGFISTKTLIDIQGLLSVYTTYYYGGLSFIDIINCIHLKEIIMPWRNLIQKKNVFRKRGYVENICLKSFKHISVQSQWVENNVKLINPLAKIYHTKIILRESFYTSVPWQFKLSKDSPVLFSSCAAAVTYKGIHILFKALYLLKKKYPNIKLNLAGNIQVGNKLIDGYSLFLKKLERKYNLTSNINYVGSLNEDEIIQHLQVCSVCVIPSFVETYSVALAESMILGVPSVVSYAGAMPEFASNGIDSLFYNSNDYVQCASHINELIQNKSLSESISSNARKRRLVENDIEIVVKTQLDIYNSLLDKK